MKSDNMHNHKTLEAGKLARRTTPHRRRLRANVAYYIADRISELTHDDKLFFDFDAIKKANVEANKIVDTVYSKYNKLNPFEFNEKCLDEVDRTIEDVFFFFRHGEKIREDLPKDAIVPAFNEKVHPELCVPGDGKPVPYPGKRQAGDVRAWLRASYPQIEGGEPLTLNWLQQNDPRAYRALYNQSTSETGAASDFLPTQMMGSEELLRNAGVDLSTEAGISHARRLYSVLTSRLYPKKVPKI